MNPQPNRLHDLKTVQPYFDDLALGRKTFDVRFNDRQYQAGDDVILREWDASIDSYTGRRLAATIVYVQTADPTLPGIEHPFVVLGLAAIHTAR